jgi:hypothetical protein
MQDNIKNSKEAFTQNVSNGSTTDNNATDLSLATDEDPNLSISNDLVSKFKTRNQATNSYKVINYAEGDRSKKGDWNGDYDASNGLLNVSAANETTTHASVQGFNQSLASEPQLFDNSQHNEYFNKVEQKDVKQNETPEEIFNIHNYLPQESNKDWFEVMPEPVSVKNRHLINISRHVGVNTIGSSLRNPSYDIRGSVPCPKMVVSPWLQTTIEPDINIKSLCA